MSRCHPEMQCFHGKVKGAGRFSARFDCDDCAQLSIDLGCEQRDAYGRYVDPYLFPIDPAVDPSKWWLRYCKHEHVRDESVKDRNVCTICSKENW